MLLKLLERIPALNVLNHCFIEFLPVCPFSPILLLTVYVHYNAAEVPLESMQDRMEIREEVFKGDIKRVIEKLNALNPEILKNQPDLDFMLQQQYFIELVREKGPDKIEECLDFARRELAPRAAENEQSLGEMERVMALLAFPDPANSAVGDLLSYDRREKVISALNTAILNSQSQSKDPKILKILRQLVK